jgi:putative lipoprotein (rSAM/lipoprotein system)
MKKFLKAYNALIAALLTLLGFASACTNGGDEYGPPMVEYGTPSADFIIRGKVSSAETQQPVTGIAVVMDEQRGGRRDSVTTASDGTYEVVAWGAFPTEQTYDLTFSDIDGAANGAFRDTTVAVVFTDPVFTGGDGHWYSGQTATERNLPLTPKE